MTTTIPRLAPLLMHLGISRLNRSPIGSARVVHGLERMLQPDDPQSTGFPPALKRVPAQMQHQNVHNRHGHGVLQVCFLSPVPRLLVVQGHD